MAFDRQKFKALVHYICRTCREVEKLGATKLHKILWLSDVLAFQDFGKPITDEVYVKKQFGPYSTHLNSALQDLEQEGRLAVRKIAWADGKTKTEYLASGEPQRSPFSADEIRLIDDIRDYVCEEHTAATISDLTHDDIWKMALLNEPIPYESILVSSLGKATQEDLRWAQEEIGKIQ